MFGKKRQKKYDASDLPTPACNGDIERVKEMLAAGTGTEAYNNSRTPILWAAYKGHAGIVRLLIEAGADMNAQGTGFAENNALHEAAGEGHADVARVLIEFGMALDVQNYSTETPLIMAAHKGRMEIVRLLVDAGADLNVQDGHGKTALYHATEAGHAEIVDTLLAAGADHSIKTRKGHTALERAKFDKQAEIAGNLSRRHFGWHKRNDNEVSHIFEAHDRQLTEVFNFATRERRVFATNTASQAEAMFISPFRDVPEENLSEAADQLRTLGGNDHTATYRIKTASGIKIGF